MNILNKFFSYFTQKEKNPYIALGKEEGIKDLVSRFYQIMNSDPKALDCKKIHPLDDEGNIPQEVQDKLYFFIVGFSGGPQLFMQKIGPPKMRMRHGHVKISERERDQWLYCMNKALKKIKLNRKEFKTIMNSFIALAFRIQNTHK